MVSIKDVIKFASKRAQVEFSFTDGSTDTFNGYIADIIVDFQNCIENGVMPVSDLAVRLTHAFFDGLRASVDPSYIASSIAKGVGAVSSIDEWLRAVNVIIALVDTDELLQGYEQSMQRSGLNEDWDTVKDRVIKWWCRNVFRDDVEGASTLFEHASQSSSISIADVYLSRSLHGLRQVLMLNSKVNPSNTAHGRGGERSDG